MNKDKKMLFGIGIAFLFLATVSLSYAYFTATLVNKDVKDQIVTTGTLQLTYTDGPEIVMNNIKPGATITKEVSVKNTGTLNASYNLVWQELVNLIANDEMVIEATCTRYNNDTVEGTCESLSSTPIKRIKIKENVSIELNVTHKYNITITFKEANADQNYNQSKSFTGTLGINEYIENNPIYCTFDGDMVQGAEYVNGQYTYRYLKEYTRNPRPTGSNDLRVDHNIENGWSVVLTNVTSTEPVTSKVCTYINNMPVTSMSMMYTNSKATSIDLSSINTSNVTNMESMFEGTTAKTLDVSNFDTSKVTYMNGMFWNSEATIIDLNGIKTSNVTNMGNIFQGSKSTILDVSSFDTSSVTNMYGMFFNSPATTLDLNNFKTSNVTSMRLMFCNSKALIIRGLNKFDTSNVTNMNSMFEGSYVEEIDVSSFDTKNVTDMSYMFSRSSSLKRIYVSDKFNTSKVTSSNDMFNDSTYLVGGNGTKYNSSYVDKTYARIDANGTPGYFTLKTN